MSKKPFQFRNRSKGVLLGLSQAFIDEPHDLKINNRDGLFLEKATLMVREFPWFLRFGFVWGLWFLDRWTLFYGFGLKRFCKLDLAQKRIYVERLKTSRFNLYRQTLNAYRGLIMIVYFSHHDIWSYIGFNPEPHIQKKIQLRQKLLAQTQDPSSSTV